MLKEFRDFAMKGNVIDMAVGVIIGASFGKIVSSIVTDIIMPPLGFLIGNVDFSNLYIKIKDGAQAAPYSSLAEAQKAGAVTINYGLFLNNLLSFLIVAWAVFLLVRLVNRLPVITKNGAVPTTKDCPYCFSSISLKARRCPHCTSNIDHA